MPRKRCVYKVRIQENLDWVHFSQQDNTVKLRWFRPGDTRLEELNLSTAPHQQRLNHVLAAAEEFSIGTIAAYTDDVLPYSATQVKVDQDDDKWIAIFQRLRELGDISPIRPLQGQAAVREQPPPTKRKNSRSPIPQTRLRRFYETMRMLNETELQERIADYLVGKTKERSDRIQVMFEESEQHFARYRNVNEAFHERQRPDWFKQYVNKSDKFARCLVARLQPQDGQPCTFPVEGWVNLRAVDYEISPFRTTDRATFENGKIGTSGGGGLDLLLQNIATGLPVVGEIKAPTDRDLFLALIQALTYSVELTTPHQRNRLRNTYSVLKEAAWEDSGPHCDICLIYKKGEAPRLANQTRKLAVQLLKHPQSPVARRVGAIVFVSADLLSNGGVNFRMEFCTERIVGR